jgi:hypothetical protein
VRRLHLALAALAIVVVYSHLVAWQKIEAAQRDRTPPAIDINAD